MNKLMEEIKNAKKEIIKVEENSKRELTWDIAKGIGIISIVIGHITINKIAHDFVYMYHLAIFYFLSAYFYNENKYGDKPFEFFAQRLKTTWPKFVFFSIILILCHNLFIKYHLYNPNAEIYSKFDHIISPILNSMTLQTSEVFAGALWFVPTLLISLGLFGGMVYIARSGSKKIAKLIKNENTEKLIKYIIILELTLVYALIGAYINENKIHLAYHAQTAIIVIPICTMGYFFRINSQKLEKTKNLKISIPILIISTALILYMIIKKNIAIELSAEMIGGSGYMFYIASFIGICFCISASRVIEKIPVLNKIIALLGKHSFSIMALHFACVKGVDVIYSKIIGETNPEVISRWVVTYPKELWLIYIIIGCGLPVIFSIVIDKIKKEREKI